MGKCETVLTGLTSPLAEKLSNIVRSVSVSDVSSHRGNQNTPTPWDINGNRGHEDNATSMRDSRDPRRRHSRDTNSQRERVERLTTPSTRQPHSRSDSGITEIASSGDYGDGQHHSTGRRHDYDVQAMESDLSPRPGITRNPIPAPIVTVRSEFPTLNRSRQQQTLTCLVTVEVPEGNWHPDVEDLRHTAQIPALRNEELASPPIKQAARSLPIPYEAQEALEEITEDLRMRVDNWHGLEFQRYVYIYNYFKCEMML